MTASVEAINYTNREVTLKGPEGNTVTFTAGPQVKRLNEIKVGDLVHADYYVSVAAELRKPTAEEEKNPVSVTEGAEREPKSKAPGGIKARRVKIVTTIEAIDRAAHTVPVKGPGGNTVTARVQHPENLAKMRVGEHIVVTYTEALAVSLEKVKGGKMKDQ